MVAFDDEGRMLIAESSYRGGGGAEVSRIEDDGTKTVLVGDQAFGDQVPVTAVAAHDGLVYVVHAGTVSVVEDDGTLRTILSARLPSPRSRRRPSISDAAGCGTRRTTPSLRLGMPRRWHRSHHGLSHRAPVAANEAGIAGFLVAGGW